MSHKIIADVSLPAEILDMIGEGVDIHIWSDAPPDGQTLRQAQGFYTYSHTIVGPDLMDQMPDLKVISNLGVGVDHIDLEAARERNVPVGNTPNILDGATADMTMALLMAAARNIVIGDRFARGPEFTYYDPSILLGQEVHSSTIGIIGMGNIGRQVAQRARAFDMKILYHNRRPNPEAEAQLGATYASLHDLLAQSDYVTLNVPLTDETRNMIGRKQLQMMKPTAILVNLARGGVVDHDALVEALENRWIYAAALDVTEPEPLPRDHVLLELDNLVIVPHLGSATVQTRRAMGQLSVDNLKAGLEGRDLPSRIA